MAQLVIKVEDNHIGFLVELLQKFDFVEIENLYDVELSDEQKSILEERLIKYKEDPDASVDWNDVKNHIEKRYEL
jgi:uncharacterized protein YpuA (DUF1002 family)